MARDVTIDLGNFNLASYLDENFVLAVSTSITLCLPEQYSGIPTASELFDQVKLGKLWTTRAGSCHLKLGVGFEAYTGFEGDMENMVIRAFETFPVSKTHPILDRRLY